MNKPIIGHVLRQLREGRGWTLEDLATQCRTAAQCRISVDSLSRIENGKQSGKRPRTRGVLAKAFGVEPGVLTGDKPPPAVAKDRPAPQPDTGQYQINIRVDEALRNAFSLVVLRYQVPRTRIIELAPFLFVLAAERSLERRRVRLEAVKEALGRADAAAAAFHHLPKTIAPGFEADEAIRAERDSVAVRDLLAERLSDDLYSLFGPQKEHYDAEMDNPFVSSLREDAPDPDIAEITGFSRTGVGFRVCGADALELAGGDERLAAGILEGWAPLHEMPLDVLKATFSRKELAALGADDDNTERRLAWLRERADAHEAASAGAVLSSEDLL